MKPFIRIAYCLHRGYGRALAGLLLVLLPLLARAGTPVLTFQATVPGSAGTNVMAFVDQVEIVNANSGVVMASAVPNTSFETFTAPLQFNNYGPNPAGASWTFDTRSGIGRVGGDLTPPPTASGSYVGYVQTADGVAGAFRQTLPNLVPGLYRVRLRVAQRNIAPANQGVRVLVDGVALGTVVPANNGAFALYNSATFVVARPSTSIVFPGGAALTTDGSTALDAGEYVVSAVTDADGDGLLDLLVGNEAGNVLRYEQTTPNGSIFAGGTLLTTDGTNQLDADRAATPTVTDVDGDGQLDLLVGNINGNVLRYEQTQANGLVFGGGTALTIDGSMALNAGTLAAPVVTDVDGDGLLDLLVGNINGNVRHYEQTQANGLVFAGGTLLTTDGTASLNAGQYATPTVTDVDGNGLLDLLVGNGSGNVRRYEQTLPNGLVFAGGTALTTNGTATLDAGAFIAPTVTDVDGDGLLDLLVSNASGNVLRFGQADPPTALALTPQAVAENAASGTVLGTFSTTDNTSGDTFTYTLVSGDGSADNASFAIGSGANAGKLVTAAVFDFETKASYTVRVRSTDATGLFTEQAFTIGITDAVEAPTLTGVAPGTGPLGTTLILTGTNLAGLTSVLVGEVPARFTVTSNTSATATVPRQATSQKVRVSNAAGTALSAAAFQVTRPSAGGVFPGGLVLTTDGTTPVQPVAYSAPAVCDVDGDGLLDLIIGVGNSTNGSVWRFEQTTANGDQFAQVGALTTNGTALLTTGSFAIPVVTDVDGDGRLDLLLGNGAGTVARFEQTAAQGGNFASAGALTTDGTATLDVGDFSNLASTDLDGDGLLDLLVANNPGNIQRYEQTAANSSSFGFVAALTDADGAMFALGNIGLAVTDIDSDGLLDLLLGAGQVRRFEQTAAGANTFASLGSITANGVAAVNAGSQVKPAVTDLDGDGLLDLLVGNSTGTIRRYEQSDPPTALALAPQAVAENAASGTVVGTFTTTDATPGDTFTYTLVTGTGSTDNASFAIGTGADAGKLLTAAVFDFETRSSYTVRVRTTDALGIYKEQAFTISITDVVEAPTIASFTPGSGPAGTSVTVTGTNLAGATAVTVNGVAGSITGTPTATSLTFAVGAGSSTGLIRITTPDGTGVSATAFTVPPPLTVIYQEPARNQQDAPVGSNVVVRLTAQLANTAATRGALLVFSQQRGGRMGGTAGGVASVSGSFLTFNPTNDFKPGETVYATTTTAATATNGATLARGHVHQFTAAAGGTGVGRFVAPATNPEVAVGNGPGSVALGDVDGDGDLDLLTANQYNNNVSVRLNNGSGRYAAPATNPEVAVGREPYSVVLGDVDGDGDLDMLTANALGRSVSVRLNNGSGTFSAPALNPDVAVGANPLSVVVGDVDGDGDLDLLTTNSGDYTVSVRLNDGTGNFTAPALNPNPAVDNGPISVVLGDVDGDGDLDLAVGNFDIGTVSILRNDGTGSFTASAATPDVAVGGEPRAVALGDVDGDGDLDLLAANAGSGTVSVRLNDGSGRFTAPALNPDVAVGSGPRSVVLGDVDGDGDLDLTAGNFGGNTVSLRLNDGTGNFTAPALNPELTVGSSSRSVTLGDVDGDGDLDLLAANLSANTVSVRLNQPLLLVVTAVAPARNLRNAPVGSTVAVTFSYALQNTAATQGGVKVFSQQRGGRMGGSSGGVASVSGRTITFDPTNDFKPGETVYVSATPAATATNFVTLTQGQVYQFTAAVGGAGRGNFGAPATDPDPAVGQRPNSLAVGDLDGDGDLDMLVANDTDNTVSIRLNDGSGRYTAPATDPEVATGGSPVVALGDADGDGDLDMFVANRFGGSRVSVLLNNGLGSFAGGSDVYVGFDPRNLTVGDVDGDGDPDVLTANYSSGGSGTVSVRLNDGTGSFTPPATNPDPAVGSGPISVVLGDVDGDGDLDLLAANFVDNTVSLRLNDGTGNFTPPATNPEVAVGSGAGSVALGDVDGDGDLDLLTANSGSNNVSVRLNDGTGSFTPPATNPEVAVGNSPYTAALGDVDGDGDLDLVVSNKAGSTYSTAPTFGSASVRLNNGTGRFSAPAATPEPSVGTATAEFGPGPAGLVLRDVDGDGDLDLLTANSGSNNVSVRLNQDAALPVELTEFTATVAGPALVRLAWTTATELNSQHFEVERSTDGRTFTRFGMVAAAGSSSSPRSYELPDNQLPAGAALLYYRLRQIDLDGSFSYSPVRTIRLDGLATLNLYPNPTFNGGATLTGATPGAAVTVSDALGRLILTATVDSTGTAALQLPLALPTGVYVVRVGRNAVRLVVE